MSERAALRWGLVLAALWAVVALCVVHPEVVGLFHDDGIYVATAKALAEGRGYRLIDLPGAPAQTKYPPLFPLALSLIWRAAPGFPGNVIWLKTFGILCTAAALVLFQRVALRSIGLTPAASVAALAVTITSPRLLASANWVLAEPLLGVATALALLAAARRQPDRNPAFAAAQAGALAGAAALVHLQGLAVVVALPVAFLCERRRREAALALVAAAIPLVAWRVWCALQWAPTSPLLTYYSSYASTVSPFSYGAGWRSLAEVALVRGTELPAALGRLMSGAAAGGFWTGVVLLAGACGGAAVAVTRRRWHVALATGFALALTMAVPWPPTRFLLPWLPLLVALAASAWVVLPRRGRRLGAILAIAVAVVGVARSVQSARAVESASTPDAVSLSSGRGDWPGWLESAAWLAAHTPRAAVVASHHDPFYFLFGGRVGLRFVRFSPLAQPAADAPRSLADLRSLGVAWLILDPGAVDLDRAGPAALALGRALVALPEARARLAFRSADHGHEVWELGAATASPPAR